MKRFSYHRLRSDCKMSVEVWTVTRAKQYEIIGYVWWCAKRRRHEFKMAGSTDLSFDAETLQDVVRFIQKVARERERCRSRKRG